MAVAIGALVLVAGVAPTAPAQETPAKPGILLEQLTAPTPVAPPGSMTRDDLRELPPPRGDRLSDAVHFQVIVTDPRCLPGEDMPLDSWRAGRPSRRR